MGNKLALTIIVSIILTVIMISTVNVGTSLFLEKPEYSDYCDESKMAPAICRLDENGDCITPKLDYNYNECNDRYDEAKEPYNQFRYYIFAGLGFLLLLIGLFAKENMIQFTGLSTGGILVAQGIVMNFQNKGIVFTSLIVILIIFGILAYRIINKQT